MPWFGSSGFLATRHLGGNDGNDGNGGSNQLVELGGFDFPVVGPNQMPHWVLSSPSYAKNLKVLLTSEELCYIVYSLSIEPWPSWVLTVATVLPLTRTFCPEKLPNFNMQMKHMISFSYRPSMHAWVCLYIRNTLSCLWEIRGDRWADESAWCSLR